VASVFNIGISFAGMERASFGEYVFFFYLGSTQALALLPITPLLLKNVIRQFTYSRTGAVYNI
jgi:hypothetical protein